MEKSLTDGEWQRSERLLDYEEIAWLSKHAENLFEIFNSYGVEHLITPATLDLAFARWLSESSPLWDAQEITTCLGVAFGNYLCTELGMHWIEIKDQVGTTFAVRHEQKAVHCFPFESIRKRIDRREIDFFVSIESSIREAVLDRNTQSQLIAQHTGKNG